MGHDIAQECFQGALPPTFFKKNVTPGTQGIGVTRIDTIIANLAGAGVCDNVEYWYDTSKSFNHVSFQVTFNEEECEDSLLLPRYRPHPSLYAIAAQGP